jgi:hypothetical protein
LKPPLQREEQAFPSQVAAPLAGAAQFVAIVQTAQAPIIVHLSSLAGCS